jgi:hypothetical protein
MPSTSHTGDTNNIYVGYRAVCGGDVPVYMLFYLAARAYEGPLIKGVEEKSTLRSKQSIHFLILILKKLLSVLSVMVRSPHDCHPSHGDPDDSDPLTILKQPTRRLDTHRALVQSSFTELIPKLKSPALQAVTKALL